MPTGSLASRRAICIVAFCAPRSRLNGCARSGARRPPLGPPRRSRGRAPDPPNLSAGPPVSPLRQGGNLRGKREHRLRADQAKLHVAIFGGLRQLEHERIVELVPALLQRLGGGEAAAVWLSRQSR